MARPVSSSDARDLMVSHKDLIDRLKDTVLKSESHKNNIREAAKLIAVKETLEILRFTPIEELNNHQKGIRTKTLRENNFTSISSVYLTSVNNLSAIRGISQEAAFLIKQISDDIYENTQQKIKIKLNTDDKSWQSSTLAKDILIYKNSLPFVNKCRDILFLNEEKINEALKNIMPATNPIKWLLASKTKKNKALNGYTILSEYHVGKLKDEVYENLLELDRIDRTQASEAWDNFSLNPISFISVLEDLTPGYVGIRDVLYGLPLDLARAIQDECLFPDGLLCQLRRYQELGVKYILHQEKVLLGDEMGLGKTIQAIATMVSLKNTGATHFVVVCPASVITNWCREIVKHSRLRVTKIHGSNWKKSLNAWIDLGGVAVTTYETTKHFLLDEAFKITLLTVDEAHYIKNPMAQRTIDTLALSSHAHRLLFMTGTALENRVEEMITLINMLQPNVANQIRNITYMSSAPLFREPIAPVYYRRKREDVLTELPDLIEKEEWCILYPEEEAIYEAAVHAKRYADARRVSWNIDDLEKSSKAKQLKEIVDNAEIEGRKIIIFSFFLDTIEKIASFLGDRCLTPINGSIPPNRRQKIIDEFGRAKPGTVLVAQIQSGGTGLNIQSASVIVICEPQLKPSTENQAISRAYRMGQIRNVLVFRLLCENTVDEKINKMLADKQAIFDAFADESVAAAKSFEIDEHSFSSIIKDEIDRINAKHGITTPASSPYQRRKLAEPVVL